MQASALAATIQTTIILADLHSTVTVSYGAPYIFMMLCVVMDSV